jgi:hypothetical protein
VITYTGIDILFLNNQHLIKSVITSADYFIETYLSGQKICFQKDSTQNPVCADPAPPSTARI